MADDVTVDNGTGTGTAFDVATDDDGSGNHIQLVKLVQSANGSRTPIDADTDGLEVKVTNASIAVTGGGGASTTRVSQTPTISNGSIYAAKDAVGGLLTFASINSSSGRAVRVKTVQIVDKGQQLAALDLVLFRATFTAPTDNAAFDPTDTELADYVGTVRVTVADYDDFTDNAVAHVELAGNGMQVTPSGTALYGALVSRGTPTYTSTSDLIVALEVEQL